MEKLKEWRSTIQVLAFALITGAVLVFLPETTWDRVERFAGKGWDLIAIVAAEPAGAISLLTGLATVVAFLRGLWKRDPNKPETETATTTITTKHTGGKREGFARLDALLFLFALGGVVLAALALHGCGASAPTVAHQLVNGAGRAVVVVDDAYERTYATQAAAALEASTTAAEYASAVAPINHVEEALRAASASLRAADHVIDVWDRGGSEQWLGAAACLAAVLMDLVDALTAARVEVPPELVDALDLARPFVGLLCVEPASAIGGA